MPQQPKKANLSTVSRIVVPERPVLTEEQKELNSLKKKLKTNERDIKQALKALINAVPESVRTLTPLAGRTARKIDDISEMLEENNRYFELIEELTGQ